MQPASFEEDLEPILKQDARYHRDAYIFLRDALDHTQRLLGREPKDVVRDTKTKDRKHVSGQELLNGIRSLALELYGPMAMTVLEEWGIRTCQDFGEMVFLLVEHRLLAKTENDSRADFETGYDFNDAFRKPFLPQRKLASEATETDSARA